MFISDVELDLEELDYLNSKHYSDSLIEIIKNWNEGDPAHSLTIGLFGCWGTGKSSIVNTVKNNLSKEENYKVVYYDSWKYSNDSFRRTFLYQLSKDLGLSTKNLDKKFYNDIFRKPSIVIKIVVKFLILFFLAFFIWNFFPDDLFTKNVTLGISILSLTVVFGNEFIEIPLLNLVKFFTSFFLKEEEGYIKEKSLFSPEQFETVFNDILSNKNLKIKKDGRSEDKKIIITIDNIDRCSGEQAYELITNTKNFLSKNPNIIYIIPVDSEALENHIKRTKAINIGEEKEFLRKFFNVIIRIKNLKNGEIFKLIQKLNENYQLNLSNDTISVIAEAFSDNPRRIIQFLNNLNAELFLYDESFRIKKQAFICKLLVLREEWNYFFRELEKTSTMLDPVVYNAYFENSKNDNVKLGVFTQNTNNDNLKLETFMKNTNYITINYDLKVFYKVVSNTPLEKIISEELKEIIANKDRNENEEKLRNYINENNKNENFTYLLYSLKQAIQNNKITDTAPELFNLILEFYLLPDLEIKEFEIGKLEDDLKNSFDKFYLYLHNFDKVVKIINIMVKKYRLEFKNTFFNLYETDTRLELHQKENILFKLIEFADAENLKHDVIKFVKEYYKNEYEIKPLKIHITPEKKDLINEDILNEIIKKLSNVENSITYWEDLSYYITLGKSQESDTFITKYNVEDLIIKNFIQKFINIFESVTNIDDLEVFKNIIQYTYNIIDNLEIKKPSLDPKMQIILTKSYHDSNGRTHYLSSFEDKDLKINISMILLLLDGTNEFLYIPADNFFEEVFYKILLKKLKIDRHYKEKYANLQQGYKNPEKSIKILNLLLDDTDPNYKQETLDILLQKCLADQSIFDYLNEKKLLEPEKLYAISIRIDKKYLLKDVNQMIDNYKKDNNLE